jgi:hypothetical protein
METALTGQSGGFGEGEQPTYAFETQEERKLKKGIHQLNEPEVKARISAEVTAAMTPSQGSLELGAPVVDVAKVVDIVTAKVTELTRSLSSRGFRKPGTTLEKSCGSLNINSMPRPFLFARLISATFRDPTGPSRNYRPRPRVPERRSPEGKMSPTGQQGRRHTWHLIRSNLIAVRLIKRCPDKIHRISCSA